MPARGIANQRVDITSGTVLLGGWNANAVEAKQTDTSSEANPIFVFIVFLGLYRLYDTITDLAL